ncbi:unnamed protein product [Litomosoides sigmodontis]|uniref:Uncharacterized protein n=1 Tax=Litomosoides sigmodontis TaxID=42156 RepID=A0A3P6TKR3_LITSI|nr:unnamed protein product [Litomosoides sigmodontis]
MGLTLECNESHFTNSLSFQKVLVDLFEHFAPSNMNSTSSSKMEHSLKRIENYQGRRKISRKEVVMQHKERCFYFFAFDQLLKPEISSKNPAFL